MKCCTQCDEPKPLTAFHKKAKSPDGHNTRCRECRKSDARPDLARRRTYLRKKMYGLSDAEFSVLLDEQRGCCAICQTTLEESRNGLVIDHDHETGAVRGLLCGPCNSGIGHLGDNGETVWRAAIYLADKKSSAISACMPAKPLSITAQLGFASWPQADVLGNRI